MNTKSKSDDTQIIIETGIERRFEPDPPVLSFAAQLSDTLSSSSTATQMVQVDLDRVIEDGLGFLATGASGSGKSHLLRGLLEQTHGRVMHIVFDTEGEYVTLREKFDYLLGAREGGDLPLAVPTARLLCQRVMELGVSIILDVYELKPRERQEYVAAFLEELIETPVDRRRPVLVVIDEVHLYAPQGANAPAKEAVRDIVARGRKRGMMPVFGTQSIAKTDKQAVEGIRNKLVGYIELDVHLDRAADDLGLRGSDREKLRRLERGQFFAQGPALTREVTLVQTLPNVTHAPPMGAAAVPASLPAPAAIQAILAQFADLPAEAAVQASTLTEAKRRIAALEKELQDAQASRDHVAKADSAEPAVRVETVYVDVPVLALETIEAAREVAASMFAKADELIDAARSVTAGLHRWESRGASVEPVSSVLSLPIPAIDQETVSKSVSPPSAPKSTARRPAVTVSVSDAPGVSPPQQRILDAIGAFATLCISEPNRSNVAVWADASPKSSSYSNNLSALRTRGLVEYPSGSTVRLTLAGSAAARRSVEIKSQRDLLAVWKSRLSGPQQRILEFLWNRYRQPVPRRLIAEETGASASSSSFANNLSALRSHGLIDYPSGTTAAATSLLFPEGLPL